LTDIATAQWRFGRLGMLNRIDLRLAPHDREEDGGSGAAAAGRAWSRWNRWKRRAYPSRPR
jgi:hypothetical protein